MPWDCDRLVTVFQAIPYGCLEVLGTLKRERAFSSLKLWALRQDGPSLGPCSSSRESEPPGKTLLCAGRRVGSLGTVGICGVVGFDQAQIPIQVYEVREAGCPILAAAAREGTDLERWQRYQDPAAGIAEAERS